MRLDSVARFVTSRAALLKEKAALESRLARITEALDGAPAKAPAPRAATPAKRRRRRLAKNKMSLTEAILKATAAKPLPKAEILAAVKQLGYAFTAKNPLNSLSVTLYREKRIKNFGGKFGPAK
jgi:hypothetical protein